MLVNILQNTISSFRSASSAASIITNGLKMWLGFKTSSISGANQITPDLSGNSNVGQLFTGKALDFNGSTDTCDISGFQMAGSSATISFWINPSASNKYILDVRNSATNDRLLIQYTSANILKLTTANNVAGVTFGAITSNQWQRVVLVINGTSADAYVDGVQSGTTQTVPVIDISSANRAAIGSVWTLGTSGSLDGKLSDFQIYNAVWSADDIAYDYAKPNHLVTDNTSTSLTVTNLKGYWALNEGAGSIAYDSGSTLEADLILDGNFPLPNTNWNLRSTWTVSDNKANMLTTSVQNYLSQEDVFTANTIKTYQLKFDAVVESGRVLAQIYEGGFSTKIEVTTTANNNTVVFTTLANVSGTLYFKPAPVLGVNFQGSITNVSVREVTPSDHGGLISGATYTTQEPKILQLGMVDYSISTPVSDEVTLVANPSNPSQDILGNSVRLREHSFNLDGIGYAEIVDDSSLNISNGTLQFWLKTSDTKFNILTGQSSSEFIGQTDNGAWSFGNAGTITAYKDGSTVSTTPSYDGAWHFYTFTGINISTWTTHYIINLTSFGLDGLIDEVLIYDNVLSATQIDNNFNASKSAHEAGSSFSDDFSSDYGN